MGVCLLKQTDRDVGDGEGVSDECETWLVVAPPPRFAASGTKVAVARWPELPDRDG